MDQSAYLGAHDRETDGVRQEWMVEAGTPNTLLREGLTRDSLKAGEQIIVRGYRAKDARCRPACKANGRDVTFTDGRKVFMGSSGTGAPERRRGSERKIASH